MRDRRRSEAPLPLPTSSPAEHRAANEVIRAVFSAMIDQEVSHAEFAERVQITERTLDKWRSPALFHERTEGPGLVLVLRALHALGLTLDVRPIPGHRVRSKARLPLSVRNDLAQIERDRLRRGETLSDAQERLERVKNDAQKKGLLRDD